MAIAPEARRREEDPYTEFFIRDVPNRIVAHQSRFAVDLNRERQSAIYLEPEQSWGVQVISATPPADLVRPKLLQDGLFLVGLDLVGDKVLEINVFTPGGLVGIGRMYRADFADSVVQALESKLEIRSSYGDTLPNRALATL